MPAWPLLIVYALAVARLTGLATTDKITHPMRQALIERVNPTNRLHRWIVYLLGGADDHANGCPWCASVWIAAATAPALWYAGNHPALLIPALALAMSQVTGMIAWLGRG